MRSIQQLMKDDGLSHEQAIDQYSLEIDMIMDYHKEERQMMLSVDGICSSCYSKKDHKRDCHCSCHRSYKLDNANITYRDLPVIYIYVVLSWILAVVAIFAIWHYSKF